MRPHRLANGWHRKLRERRARHASRPVLVALETRTLLSEIQPAVASQFVVNSTKDDGSAGTLRWAINKVNGDFSDTSANPDVISFQIPGGIQGSIFDINLTSDLPAILNPVFIDGTTQPFYNSPRLSYEYAGCPLVDIVVRLGSSTATRGLTITAGSSTVRGLAIVYASDTAIQLQGNGGNTIENCYIGMNGLGASEENFNGITIAGGSFNQIGGIGAGNVIGGNTMYGLQIDGFSGTTGQNSVIGNFFGTTPDGLSFKPSGFAFSDGNGVGDIDIQNSNGNLIGGTAVGAGNVLSGTGISVDIETGQFNVIQGNHIGTDVTGTTTIGSNTGIALGGGSAHNTVGGTAAGAGNLISGNRGLGISVQGNADVIEGNLIGTDVSGTSALANGEGIEVANGATKNTIGGTAAGAGNVIAFNTGIGVGVSSGTGIAVLGNSIFANGKLGIDLGDDGVTTNSPGGNENFPTLTTASTSAAGVTTISGFLTAAPGTYRVEFFASPTADGTGHGQGKIYLGAATVTVTNSGTQNFTDNTPTAASGGLFLSATATSTTDATANTSEFADDLKVTGPQVFTVTNTLDDGSVGSLRWAIQQVNADGAATAAQPDIINFNIPSNDPGFDAGTGVGTIQPTSDLDTVTNPVIINGYSQPGATANTLSVGDNAVLRIQLDGSMDTSGNGEGLVITGGSSTVEGLVIGNFAGNAIALATKGKNVVVGNFLGTDPSGMTMHFNGGAGVSIVDPAANTIGGSTAAARNVISGNNEGVGLDQSGANAGSTTGAASPSDNVVQNNYIGVNAAGTQALKNTVEGIRISRSARNQVIGNVISGNGVEGVEVAFNDSDGNSTANVIQGNFIGTNATGTAAVPNGVGVFIQARANKTTVGGTTAAAANVISGNLTGVSLQSGVQNLVEGNFIGTRADGKTALPNGTGVTIGTGNDTPDANAIGGLAASQGNIIAANTGTGVELDSGGNAILSNSIFSNGNLGILSGTDPATFQTPPALTSAALVGSNLTVTGTVQGTPNATVTVQLFATPTLDAKNAAEGKTLLDTFSVIIDGAGAGQINRMLAAGSTGNQLISATATDTALGTSAFSNGVLATVSTGGALAFSTASFTVNENAGNASITLTRTGGSNGAVSVTLTTSDGTATAGSDYTATNQVVNWSDGDTNPKTVNIPIIDRGLTSGTRTFNVALTPVGGAALGTPSTAVVTINENDSTVSPPNAPVLTAASDTGVSQTDGLTAKNGSLSAPLVFTVTGVSPANGFVQLYVKLPQDVIEPLGAPTQAVAGVATVTVSGTPLADGTYTVDATVAATAGGAQSAASGQTAFTIQSSLQVLNITPSSNFQVSLPNNQVVVTFSHRLAGLVANQYDGHGMAASPYAVMLIPSGPDGGARAAQGLALWTAPSGYDAGDLPVPATAVYTENADGTSTITLTPHVPLPADIYVISIGAVMDLAGNSVPGGRVYSSFDLRPPLSGNALLTVTGVTTLHGTVPINGNTIPMPDTIGIAFNKPLNSWTASSTTVHLVANPSPGQYVPVQSAVAYSPSTHTVYLTPEERLVAGETYIIAVDSTVSDASQFPDLGITLGQTFYATFRPLANTPINSQPLNVLSTAPVDHMAWGAPLGYVSVTYSASVDLNQLSRYSVMLIPQTGGATTGASGFADVPYNAKLSFNPNTNQLVIVPTGAFASQFVQLISLNGAASPNFFQTFYATFLLSAPILDPAVVVSSRSAALSTAADGPARISVAPAASKLVPSVTATEPVVAVRRGRPRQETRPAPAGPLRLVRGHSRRVVELARVSSRNSEI